MSTTTDADTNTPSALCNLILAQLVYEIGENDFVQIYDRMFKHPLLATDHSVPVSADLLKEHYETLINENQLERDPEFDFEHSKKPASWVQRLAQLKFMAFSDLLLRQIKEDEVEFKQAVKDLEEIKSGARDLEL